MRTYIIKIFRKIKGFIFLLKLHYLIPSHILETLANIGRVSKFIENNNIKGDSDFYSFTHKYDRRYDLYNDIIKKENLNDAIDYIELGVSQGYSFKWWVNKNTDSESRFFGFDTFTGLPEDWGTFKKGEMSNGNEMPKIDDGRVILYQGLFQQTLPIFLKDFNEKNKKVILFDADLYTSTLYGLTTLSPIIKKGDILLFDQFNIPNHEFKAFTEWTKSFYIDFKVIGAKNNYYAVAFKIQ